MTSHKLNLGRTVIAFLKTHAETKFTARQIAEWMFENFPEACRAKKDKSQSLNTDGDFSQQLVSEIGSQRPRLQKLCPEVKATEGRPRKYYYSERSESDEVMAAESAELPVADGDAVRPRLGEHSMYPLLSQYQWHEFGVHSKRIDEKRSSS